MDFLKNVTKTLLDSNFKEIPYYLARGKKVLVIGGGDTGNDCVGTVIRLGAASVAQLEMMPKAPAGRMANNPWPEWPKVLKTDYGQEEAIDRFGHDPRIYQTTVTEFLKNKKGDICSAKTVQLAPVRDEKTGRMRMEPVPGTEKEIPADLVLIAAGFGQRELQCRNFWCQIRREDECGDSSRFLLYRKHQNFTAGDMHRGQSLVVWAIAEGTEAAARIDESLMGYTGL